MKIVYLTNSLDMGGIETNLCRLTGALSYRGHSVSICARPGTLSPTILANGGTVLDLAMRPSSPISILRDIHRLRRILSRESEIVHVLSATAALVLYLTVRSLPRSKRPVVVASLMGIQSSLNEKRWRTLLRARVTLAGADLVIITSPAIGELISELRHSPSKAIRASVVGVENPDPPRQDRVERIRTSLGIHPADYLVTTIGRLDSTKSHHLFIKAAEQVLRDRNDISFAIIGAGPLDQSLRDQIAKAGISSNVHLLGERRDITELLCASTVYVRPGIINGFVGITVLEAQSLHLPVISFDTLDVHPAIEHGVSGLLVSPNDIEQLASTIIDLVDDPVRAESIGNAGYNRFTSTFSLDSVTENLCTIYSSAILEKPS